MKKYPIILFVVFGVSVIPIWELTGQSRTIERDPHYLQFYATYEPGPGAGILGEYVVSPFRQGFATLQFGWRGELLGSAGYTWPFELDIQGRHRLTLNPSLYSDYQPNRLFNKTATDERRSGVDFRIWYEYRFHERYRFSQQLNPEFTRVWLNPEQGKSAFTNLFNLETGSRLLRFRPDGFIPVGLLLDGKWLVGYSQSDQNSFIRIRLAGRQIFELGHGFSWKGTLLGEWSSKSTPLFERPSLGGSLSVRGYRQDEVIGRNQLTFQQELMIPVPWSISSDTRLGNYLERYLRLALFFDLGGVDQTDLESNEGARTGTGVGLRWRTGSVTLSADWGHRITDIQDQHYRGNFFLSIRPDLFLLW